ncbi:glycosylphosphatidylinositol anchor attachment 1 protein [Teleopsis dalmanni]|uniref:glycosylphosphatidylinositol anchor attachment 1 protein n=1 Tax=Teleopsis dalmanni TaxID=139649 RepID=UPI0018CEC081|nr:glycosylphosphatidylinositol anchor attachment 1 protein [Teleopsis dalmanni]
MGLLSNPSFKRRSKIGRALTKHIEKISLLFYILGLTWFVCLGHNEFNHGTYLSENALSPGLVYPEVRQDASRLAQTLTEELQREQAQYKSVMPYAWIVAKMNQIGLETHVHNFTLRYPFSGGKEYQGKNIYGILRAPRIGSTEGIVFTAPYRPPTSVHTDIVASVPVLLAFANFARTKNYWAKDLIFLITEQEQLGMHAWLEAYYEGGFKDSPILKCGNIPARAGALQAAINIEVQDLDIDYIDVKIEGLNGQLPNLDLFNLVQRITAREGISSGYKQTPRKKRRSNYATLEDNVKHMSSMLLSQVSGIPTGNHGLFHRYRIEALTLEAVKRATNTNNNRSSATLSLLKTIEGISRSLNNLLERFHQSYFFYILVQNDRFVSIGDFIPCLILLTAPMFIKSFLLWHSLNDDEKEEQIEEEPTANTQTAELPYLAVFGYISVAVALGILCNIIALNEGLRNYFHSIGANSLFAVNLILGICVLIGVSLPFVTRLPERGTELLHIGALLLLGIALIVVGLLNFALGFFLAIMCSPLTIILKFPSTGGMRKSISVVYILFLNPIIVAYLIVFVLTIFKFPELISKEIVYRSISATMNASTYALMDCIIYGNWLYNTITAVFFPLWVLFWVLACARKKTTSIKQKKN